MTSFSNQISMAHTNCDSFTSIFFLRETVKVERNFWVIIVLRMFRLFLAQYLFRLPFSIAESRSTYGLNWFGACFVWR